MEPSVTKKKEKPIPKIDRKNLKRSKTQKFSSNLQKTHSTMATDEESSPKSRAMGSLWRLSNHKKTYSTITTDDELADK